MSLLANKIYLSISMIAHVDSHRGITFVASKVLIESAISFPSW